MIQKQLEVQLERHHSTTEVSVPTVTPAASVNSSTMDYKAQITVSYAS